MRDVGRFVVGAMSDQAQATAAFDTLVVTGKADGFYTCAYRSGTIQVPVGATNVAIGQSLLVGRSAQGYSAIDAAPLL